MVQKSILCIYLIALSFQVSYGVLDIHDNGEKTIFGTILEYSTELSEALDQELRPVLPEHLLGDLDLFLDVIQYNETETAACSACKTAAAALKALALVTNWENIRDPIVQICNVLFVLIDRNIQRDVLCPGVVDLQGPHVFEIFRAIHRINPEDYCFSLNACIPPKDPVIKKEPLVVVQLTDMHIEPHYSEGSDTDCGLPVCCREKYGQGTAREWGDYTCNVPEKTMNLFIEKAVELNPDFILYSGDTPPHSIWEETWHSQLNCTGRLVNKLTEMVANIPVYPNIGNHEMYPTNLYSKRLDETKDMNVEFANMWTDLAGFDQDNIDSMTDAGRYSLLYNTSLRIISFNTNYWYTANFYNVLNEKDGDIEDMHDWLEQELQNAQQSNQKVIIIGHHPPDNVKYGRRFSQIVNRYYESIVLHVAGHTHTDDIRLIIDPTESEPRGVVYVAPAATTYTNNNPSMRVYLLNPDTYRLQDFHQYMLDIKETFAQGENAQPEIKLVYSAKDEYELIDLSPSSWYNLAHRFGEDDNLFQRWYQNYQSRYNPSASCTGSCKQSYLCRMTTATQDERQECQNNYPFPGNEVTTPNPTSETNRGATFGATVLASVISFFVLVFK